MEQPQHLLFPCQHMRFGFVNCNLIALGIAEQPFSAGIARGARHDVGGSSSGQHDTTGVRAQGVATRRLEKVLHAER